MNVTSRSRPYDALLLLSSGGPDAPDGVVPFLANAARGRGIPRERLKEAGQHNCLNHPGFDGPMIEGVLTSLADLPEEVREGAHIPFTTRAVPDSRRTGKTCGRDSELAAQELHHVGPEAPDPLRQSSAAAGWPAPGAAGHRRATPPRPARGAATVGDSTPEALR